ncbi:hypothetical protein WN943_029349 [Citrus x changshan-huyou]
MSRDGGCIIINLHIHVPWKPEWKDGFTCCSKGINIDGDPDLIEHDISVFIAAPLDCGLVRPLRPNVTVVASRDARIPHYDAWDNEVDIVG